MKYSGLMVITSFFMVLLFQVVYAKDVRTEKQDEQALKSFEVIVDKFTKFLKGNPKFIDKQEGYVNGSPSTGTTIIKYQIIEYRFINISYDVQKTDSLVSPFIGYINVTGRFRSNRLCGDIKWSIGPVGWGNIEEALKNSDEESCYGWLGGEEVDRYVFVYQKGTWKFKTIDKNDLMLAVLGVRDGIFFKILSEPSGLSFNRKWRELID